MPLKTTGSKKSRGPVNLPMVMELNQPPKKKTRTKEKPLKKREKPVKIN